MKTSSIFQLLALSLILVAGALALQAQNTDANGGANALPNGNFSAVTGGWPNDWAKGKGTTFETEGGVSFLRLKQEKPGEMLMAYREIPIPANAKNLQVTIKYRTSGVVHGAQQWFDARTIFHFLGADKKNITPEPPAIRFKPDTSDWTEVTALCKVPDGAEKFVLMPSLFQVEAGTLDLAEVRVVGQP